MGMLEDPLYPEFQWYLDYPVELNCNQVSEIAMT